MKTRKTIVGSIDSDVLNFTVGKDPLYDLRLAEVDCIGSAAHVTMLAALPIPRRLYSQSEARAVVDALVDIIRSARRGRFHITADDQDVHMAVEGLLTRRLGVLGKRIHTGRSRNDQVAVDVRLRTKLDLLKTANAANELGTALLRFGRKHRNVPMVGRTHLQPAMPSSVGLWAAAFAEGLADDMTVLRAAYEVNDRCPLGSAASYGVSLPIDRRLTARLLGFREPIHTVLHAGNSRGKCEYTVVSALSATMLTLSRLSEDLVLFAMPEFGYFKLPAAYCTGSSIMPQKRNPDVMELIRARTGNVLAATMAVGSIVKGLPSGYNRDLQETKPHLLETLDTVSSSLQILARLIDGLEVDEKALLRGFTPDVFATDRALELVVSGVAFRDAYDQVKTELTTLGSRNPRTAIRKKTHLGATAGIDFTQLLGRWRQESRWITSEQKRFNRAISQLLRCDYPPLEKLRKGKRQ